MKAVSHKCKILQRERERGRSNHTWFLSLHKIYSSLLLVRYHWGGQTISNYPYYRINHQRVVIGSEANKAHPLLSSVTGRTPPPPAPREGIGYVWKHGIPRVGHSLIMWFQESLVGLICFQCMPNWYPWELVWLFFFLCVNFPGCISKGLCLH